jgi:hypothetical protein
VEVLHERGPSDGGLDLVLVEVPVRGQPRAAGEPERDRRSAAAPQELGARHPAAAVAR